VQRLFQSKFLIWRQNQWHSVTDGLFDQQFLNLKRGDFRLWGGRRGCRAAEEATEKPGFLLFSHYAADLKGSPTSPV
jgi:hypothetical protein